MDAKEKILKENLLLIKDRNIQKNVGDRWEQIAFAKRRFIPLSTIDETEMERNYNTVKI